MCTIIPADSIIKKTITVFEDVFLVENRVLNMFSILIFIKTSQDYVQESHN